MPGPMPPQGGAPGGAPAQSGQQSSPQIPPSQCIQMIHDGIQGLAPAIKAQGSQLGPQVTQGFGNLQNIFMQLVQELGKPGQAQGGAAPQGATPQGQMPENASAGSSPAPQY